MESPLLERQVVRLEGEFWTFVFDGQTCRLRDTNGVRYLVYLLDHPHREVSSLEIRRTTSPAGGDEHDDAARALERARVNVTRALGGVLRRLEPHHPGLAEHLRATIRTGAFCTYRPDPRVEATWEIDG